MSQKVILDVDTGSDDAVAILMAGHHPALELVGVTVTHGNGPLEVTLENTARVLAAGGLAHVPFYVGARYSLLNLPVPTADGQRRILPLPEAHLSPAGRAVDFLIDYYLGPQGPETIYVPVGPQTNLALALRVEPRLAQRIPRIVTMAGATSVGNVTPSAEFNVLADPEAAYVVFNAGIDLTMVGLEVTGQARLTVADVERLQALGTSQAQVTARLIQSAIHPEQQGPDWPGVEIYDACAVAAVIDPDVIQTQPMQVEIELSGALTRGRTVAYLDRDPRSRPNVAVGTGINRRRFLEILADSLG